MEVAAPAEVAAAPYALCPRFTMLAVGMAAPAAGPGDAVKAASRLDLLRLPQDTGDGRELYADYSMPAPGLRSLAWSSTPTNPDSPLMPVEKFLYPAGLLAGGFDDGAVKIWNPHPAIGCDLKMLSVAEKPKDVHIMNQDPDLSKMDEAEMVLGISQMYSDIEKDTIAWPYSGHKDYFQIEEDDAAGKKAVTVNHHTMTEMVLVTEARYLQGPVLGLSFNDMNPFWIASAAKSESIWVHDLHYPLNLSNKRQQFTQAGSSNVNAQITCLKWSKVSPTILASSGDHGITRIWDIRRAPTRSLTTFTSQDKVASSDLEFSWNNPMHVAVSTKASPSVKVWDMRKFTVPYHEYAIGDSGVVSLSWNQSGQLLTSHANGRLGCYDVYRKKMVEAVDLLHCDRGCTWLHVENVAALLSSKPGVKLYEIGGSLDEKDIPRCDL